MEVRLDSQTQENYPLAFLGSGSRIPQGYQNPQILKSLRQIDGVFAHNLCNLFPKHLNPLQMI